jgi:transforming growth factor-beta-induced protein
MKKMKVLAAGLAAAALIAAPMSASAQEDDPSIAEIAVAAELTTLLAAVTAAGLDGPLSDCTYGPVTVFAPTEQAFADAFALLGTLGITPEELLADTETLTSILLYHVLPGTVLAADVVELDGESATTANSEDITIAVADGGVVLNGSVNVIDTDNIACNGVVHVIDAVLVPPSVLEALTAEPAPTTTVATPDPEPALPDAGSSNVTTAVFAGLLLLGGAAMIGVSRRRTTV